MAQCKNCDHKGFFLSVDSNGLCGDCQSVVLPTIYRLAEIIRESMKLVNEGKTLGTRLSRCDLIVENAKGMVIYERKGIPTVSPLPSALIVEFARVYDDVVVEEANKVVDKAVSKSEVAATPRARLTALSSGLLKTREVLGSLRNPNRRHEVEGRLKPLIHKTTLDGFLEEARKAEFKGDTKKAIDQYQEALYFVRHDDIPDEEQGQELQELEAKLKELAAKK